MTQPQIDTLAGLFEALAVASCFWAAYYSWHAFGLSVDKIRRQCCHRKSRAYQRGWSEGFEVGVVFGKADREWRDDAAADARAQAIPQQYRRSSGRVH